MTYRWNKKVAFCLLRRPINLPFLHGFKHLALLTAPTTSPTLPLAHSLLHYKTFRLYLSPVYHNYSLMRTRWLHWQLRLTFPITDINSFLASLDINILRIWVCQPMMRTKTGWRNWEESYDRTNNMLPSSFFPLQTRRASVQVMQSSGRRSGFKGRRSAPLFSVLRLNCMQPCH